MKYCCHFSQVIVVVVFEKIRRMTIEARQLSLSLASLLLLRPWAQSYEGGFFGSRHRLLLSIHTKLYIKFFYYPPSSRFASCVGTMGTVTCHLQLMRPCCVALGWGGLIWDLYNHAPSRIQTIYQHVTES